MDVTKFYSYKFDVNNLSKRHLTGSNLPCECLCRRRVVLSLLSDSFQRGRVVLRKDFMSHRKMMGHYMGDAIFRAFIDDGGGFMTDEDEIETVVDELSSRPYADARWIDTPSPAHSARLIAPSRDRALLVESTVALIHSWLGLDVASRTAPGAGHRQWSQRVLRSHRDGRCLMAVCTAWKRSVASNPAFFGRLLARVGDDLPRVAHLHGRCTKWLTVDGHQRGRYAEDEALVTRRSLSYVMAGGAAANRQKLSQNSTAALWRSLSLMPNLETLEISRATFSPDGPSPARFLGSSLDLKTLCLYSVAGLTADVVTDLVSLCPRLETLEVHHACPWRKYRSSSGRVSRRDDEDDDDSVGAWIAGAAMTAPPKLRTLRLGDGVDDSALGWVSQLPELCCLNVMHTYACDTLPNSLRLALDSCSLLALSIHVDGRDQSCDEIAQVVAHSRCAPTLKVLAIADHVPTSSQAAIVTTTTTTNTANQPAPRRQNSPVEPPSINTLTDAGLAAIGLNCVNLSRLMFDDAATITVRGALALIFRLPRLEQLALRRCFSTNFNGGAKLYDIAKSRSVNVIWEPREDQNLFKPIG